MGARILHALVICMMGYEILRTISQPNIANSIYTLDQRPTKNIRFNIQRHIRSYGCTVHICYQWRIWKGVSGFKLPPKLEFFFLLNFLGSNGEKKTRPKLESSLGTPLYSIILIEYMWNSRCMAKSIGPENLFWFIDCSLSMSTFFRSLQFLPNSWKRESVREWEKRIGWVDG